MIIKDKDDKDTTFEDMQRYRKEWGNILEPYRKLVEFSYDLMHMILFASLMTLFTYSIYSLVTGPLLMFSLAVITISLIVVCIYLIIYLLAWIRFQIFLYKWYKESPDSWSRMWGKDVTWKSKLKWNIRNKFKILMT